MWRWPLFFFCQIFVCLLHGSGKRIIGCSAKRFERQLKNGGLNFCVLHIGVTFCPYRQNPVQIGIIFALIA